MNRIEKPFLKCGASERRSLSSHTADTLGTASSAGDYTKPRGTRRRRLRSTAGMGTGRSGWFNAHYDPQGSNSLELRDRISLEAAVKTKALLFVAWLLLSFPRATAATNEPVSLFMPDGQMRSHLLRVYVNADIQTNDKPELTLLPGRFGILKPADWTRRPKPPREVARFQQWTEKRDGITTGRTGTLLLFDLREAEFTLMPFTLVTPMLKWGELRQTAINDRPVYIGNLF